VSGICDSQPKRVSVILCVGQWDALQRLARSRGDTASSLIRMLISDALANQGVICPLAGPREAPRAELWSPDRELL